MNDTPQTADGRVLQHFITSLDGFVAGPNHEMDWMMGDFTNRPGLADEYIETMGAVLEGTVSTNGCRPQAGGAPC